MFIEKAGCRWIVAVMVFGNTCINYMMRVNISVNIVAMIPISNVTYVHSQDTLDWTPFQKANVLSSYFWGYLVSCSVSGLSAERFGAKKLIVIMVSLGAILTILTPSAAKSSFVIILIVRFGIGLFSGFLFPALFILIGNWAVPNERGKFLGAFIGGTIGTFFTWTLCGVIIEAFGWEWGFYTFGIIALIWCIPWWFLIYDSPNIHPRISLKEIQYINEGTQKNKTPKQLPPYRKMLSTPSVWSLLILNFGTGWGIYFVITAAPSYLANALGYKISSSGALSGMIYLGRSMASFAFGTTGDILLKRNIVSVQVLRRLGVFASHIIPGCLMFCLSIPGYSPIVYVVIITLAMTMNGSVTLSSFANPYDLTSNFVGTLTSFTQAVTTTAGIISPPVTAYFTKDNEMISEAWKPVFYTGSLVYIISGLQFIICGSTKKQAWDVIKPEREMQCERL